jgi:eukaryotic-like serine/threonine-protein kinase
MSARGSSPAPTPSSGGGALRRLPALMVGEAAKRTAWLSLSTAILVPAIVVFQRWMQPALSMAMMNDVNRLLALAMVLSASGLFALHRYRVVGPSRILSLGMALQVFGAFVISMMETSIPISADRPVLGVSKVAAWVLAFGLVVPNRPAWTLIWASTAAATWPLAYAINAALFDFAPVSSRQLGVWPFFTGCMVVVTYLIGRQTYGVALAAGTARDLGSYRLVAPIAEGGMGEVWRADHQMLVRKAAIKLIRPQVESGSQADTAVRRFRREANAIASLQSPHTVYLYDFGASDDGRLYYAMELLDGISLQSLVSNFGPQPPARVLRIVRQICSSLEEAHRAGLVHRDLKPSNVMLCKVALTYDFVKVLDFGLAKFTRGPEVSQWTSIGTATGTPGYIAPEIATGESSIDGRADIYSLGCVAYFLLTGALVFDDPNPMKMALQHVQAVPVPPSARTTLPIPAALEHIVLQCLAKKPTERPSSAAAVGAMLGALTIAAWTEEDAEEWWHLHLPPTSALRTLPEGSAAAAGVIRKM